MSNDLYIMLINMIYQNKKDLNASEQEKILNNGETIVATFTKKVESIKSVKDLNQNEIWNLLFLSGYLNSQREKISDVYNKVKGFNPYKEGDLTLTGLLRLLNMDCILNIHLSEKSIDEFWELVTASKSLNKKLQTAKYNKEEDYIENDYIYGINKGQLEELSQLAKILGFTKISGQILNCDINNKGDISKKIKSLFASVETKLNDEFVSVLSKVSGKKNISDIIGIISDPKNNLTVESTQSKFVLKELLKLINSNVENWLKSYDEIYEYDPSNSNISLEKSIKIAKKIRNSFDHDNTSISQDYIPINPDKLNIKLPLEYLRGFNVGKIVVSEDDKQIIEQVNEVFKKFLTQNRMSLNIDEFLSNPDLLFYSFLKEYFGEDYNQLPIEALKHEWSTRKLIEGYENNKFTIKVIDLPGFAFVNADNTINLLEYLERSGNDNITQYIKKLPLGAFYYVENAKKLNKMYKNKEIAVDITELPDAAFKNIENTKILLSSLEFDVAKKLPFEAYDHVENTKSLVRAQKESQLDIKIDNLPKEAFVNSDSTLSLMKKFNQLKIYNVSEKVFINSERTLNFIDKLKKLHINVSEIWDIIEEFKLYNDNLSIAAFQNFDSTLEILKYIKDKNLNVDVECLPDEAFYDYDGDFEVVELTQEILNISKKNGLNLKKIRKTAIQELFSMYKGLITLRNVYINGKEKYENAEQKIYEAMGISKTDLQQENISIKGLKSVIEVLKKLEGLQTEEGQFQAIYNTLQIVEYLNKNNIDPSTLGYNIFLYEKGASELIKYCDERNLSLNITLMPEVAFGYYEITQELLKQDVCVNRLQTDLFMILSEYNDPQQWSEIIQLLKHKDLIYSKKFLNKFRYCDKINLKEKMAYLFGLDLTIGELEEIPFEFFSRNISMSMLPTSQQEKKKIKKIIKIKDPRIFVLSIYINSVMRKYDHSLLKGNITNFITQKNAHIIQMPVKKLRISTDSGDITNIAYVDVSLLLNKIRNSSVHFRIEPVEDEQGNIIKDKVYLYDQESETAPKNFEMIVDIRDILKLIQLIELNLQNYGVNQNPLNTTNGVNQNPVNKTNGKF